MGRGKKKLFLLPRLVRNRRDVDSSIRAANTILLFRNRNKSNCDKASRVFNEINTEFAAFWDSGRKREGEFLNSYVTY